ncbi:MAG: Ig-like domain-containing protein [Bacillota bacterium]
MLRKWRIAIAVTAAVAVVSMAVWAAFRPASKTLEPTPPDALPAQVVAEVTLTPAKPDPAGLDPAGALTLTTTKPLSAAAVRQSLTVQPAVPLQVEQADGEGKSFTVKPVQALVSNRVYRFQLAPAAGVSRPYQWSFQTRMEFRLLGTLPRNQGTGVPVNTGIEFTFSHEDYEDPTPYFQIEPAVPGRFERHKKTVSFVPASQFQPGTIYTVTLKQGLRRTQGEGRLTEDHTFSFETQDPKQEGKRQGFVIPTGLAEFPAADQPFFPVWNRETSTDPIEVSVYRYPDAHGFIAALEKAEKTPWWANASRSRYQEDVSALTQVAAFTAQIQAYENGNFILFPDVLPPGYYLAGFQSGDLLRQVRFQVTDISSHITVTTTRTLLWLNDVSTRRPVAGAEVAIAGGSLRAATGSDGVATLPTPEALAKSPEQPLYLTARAGAKETVIYAAPSYWYYDYNRGVQPLYWKYLYLDRSLYKPADTVQVWGVVHPREPEASPVTEVTVEIVRNEYRSPDGETLPLVSATLPVRNATFIGSLDLPNLKPGHYEVRVRLGKETLRSHWFEVATYSKPAYQVEVTTDKRAIFTGEPVSFRVKASFFEGTPVPNMPLKYRLNWGGKGDEQVTTDANGEAVITYTPPHNDGHASGYPSTLWFTVNAGLPELGQITDERTVSLFLRDTTTATRVEQREGEATVTLQLNRVVLDKINAGEGREYRGPAIAGREVWFELIELNWNKVSEGRYYDFIEKVVRERYRYEEAHKTLGSHPARSDAGGMAHYTFPVDPEKRYQVKIYTQDSRGLRITDSTHVSGRRFVYPYGDRYYRWHHLAPEVPNKHEADVGEPIGFVMKLDDTPVTDREKGFLFFTARRGLQDYKVQDSATFRMALREEDLPNTNLTVIHFDGRRYHQAQRTVRFDSDQRKLQVSVKPDKPAYRPGDEVKLDVTVLDRDGRPAAGTEVNLNLVDEALYALRDQQVNLLGSLYGEHISPGILRSRSSHDVPEPGGGAEKGGEGGGVRRDFKDAVFFASVTADKDGQATASFRVPDNLTTWRLTYQAFRPSTLEGGNGSVGIPVKLPFFVEMVLGESYLTGDEPVLQIRSYGVPLTSSAVVEYAIEVREPSGLARDFMQSGPPATPVVVPLKRLDQPGTYTVLVRGSTGDLSDALEKRFTVADSYQRQNRVDFALLDEKTRIKGADEGLTTLTFLDWERGRYLAMLYRSLWNWGNRFEMKLAREVATQLLTEHFDRKDLWSEPEFDPFQYQTPDGSIAILPYSDGDLKLSALTADLAADRFDPTALALYFRRVLDDQGEGRERKVLALYGLASLNEPVLLTARSLLAEKDLSVTEQLYLALAVAELGDLESVRPLYRDLVSQQGEKVGRDLRLKAGRDTDEQLEATALAAALAGKLGEPETIAFVSYLTENQPAESLILLEQLLAVKSGLEHLPRRPVAFTFLVGGQETRRELKPGESFRFSATPNDLASLRFKDVEGSVAVIATYEAPGVPKAEPNAASITRTFSPPAEKLKAGDIVTVTLQYSLPATAPKGAYEITDYLPAGLKLLERPWSYGVKPQWDKYIGWPLMVEGQKVTFWAGDNSSPVRYYARVVTPGLYQAEEPVLQHQKSGLVYGLGSRQVVRIEW